jgi:hypothetical protein
VYDYHQKCYEAHERIKQRHREARGRRQRRRRAQLADALGRLIYAPLRFEA